MLEAASWGLIAASSLVIGSLLTFWLKPGRRLIGLIMAFGAGTLIAAIAYDLVEDAAVSGRTLTLGLGLALGAVTFFVGDWWVDRAGGEHRKRSSGAQASGVSIAFLVAVFISNLPEAIGAIFILLAVGASIGTAKCS